MQDSRHSPDKLALTLVLMRKQLYFLWRRKEIKKLMGTLARQVVNALWACWSHIHFLLEGHLSSCKNFTHEGTNARCVWNVTMAFLTSACFCFALLLQKTHGRKYHTSIDASQCMLSCLRGGWSWIPVTAVHRSQMTQINNRKCAKAQHEYPLWADPGFWRGREKAWKSRSLTHQL